MWKTAIIQRIGQKIGRSQPKKGQETKDCNQQINNEHWHKKRLNFEKEKGKQSLKGEGSIGDD